MGSDFEIAIKVAPHHIEWEMMLWAAIHADTSPVYSDFGILITFILFMGTQVAHALNLGLRSQRLPKQLLA